MSQQNDLNKDQAVLRMKLAEQFCRFLRKAYDVFGQPQSLIGKNLTKTSFWFFIDTMYFYLDQKEDLQAKNSLINHKHQPSHQFQEIDDLQFILKLRKLISQQKLGTMNISDIKSTNIDQVIQIAQRHLSNIENQNRIKIQQMESKYFLEKKTIKNQLAKFKTQYKQTHPMFYYEQMEAELIRKWVQQQGKLAHRQKCYLCSRPHKLITCNVKNCFLKVHPGCYPTFSHTVDSKTQRPTEQQLKSFVCQNCQNQIDSENTKCELCCCVGGHFVKVNQQESQYKIVFNRQSIHDQNNKSTNIQLKIINQQQSRKQKYIHLSCFIWNTQLKWNKNINMVEGLSKIIKKKINGMCSLCGISFGSGIPCSNQTCRRFYHAQCAKRHGLQMNLIRAKTSVIQLFCQRHRHLNRHQSLEQAEVNKFRQVKKLFDGVDKQIKRLHVSASYQQIKLVVERDYCSVCGKQQNYQKITICRQCRKWYHNSCSQNCKNCA